MATLSLHLTAACEECGGVTPQRGCGSTSGLCRKSPQVRPFAMSSPVSRFKQARAGGPVTAATRNVRAKFLSQDGLEGVDRLCTAKAAGFQETTWKKGKARIVTRQSEKWAGAKDATEALPLGRAQVMHSLLHHYWQTLIGG